MQSSNFVLCILSTVAALIFLWIIIIHYRVNRLRKEIEKLKKIAEG